MNVDDIGAEIRPRTPWEAVDLGFAMAAGWRWPILRAWLVAVGIPVAAILAAGWQHPGWALFVLWWLKPVFDRVALFVISRKLFGGDVQLMTVLSHLRGLYVHRGLIGSLTVRRFSFSRSVVLPVRQLEGSRGIALTKRLRILMQGRSGRSGANLTLACMMLEVCLTLSCLAMISLVIPGDLLPWADTFAGRMPDEAERVLLRAVFVAWFLAISWVEPVFVAGGFGLYINHRSFLEGWDVQFAFEGLGRRARALTAEAGRIAGGMLLAGLLALGTATDVQAHVDAPIQDQTLGLKPDQELGPRATAEEIAARPEFDTTEMRKVRKSSSRDSSWSCSSQQQGSAPDSVAVGGFAAFLEILVWIGIAVLVLVILFAILKAVAGRRLQLQQRVKPTTVFGLDVTPESLPDDLPGEALALWRAGDARGCLSLLYRGAITHLIDQDELFIEESDTERDCVRRVENNLEATRFQYFEQLTTAWQRCAYGRLLPRSSEAELLISKWAMHFDPLHTAANTEPAEVNA